MRYLINSKGHMLGWIVVLGAVAAIAATTIPKVNTAIENRKEITVQYFNGTDTITEFE